MSVGYLILKTVKKWEINFEDGYLVVDTLAAVFGYEW